MLFENMPVITGEEVDRALRFSAEQVVRNLPEFTHKFQKAYSENGFYHPIENNYWTTGFWTGEIWLAYEYMKGLGEAGKDAAGQLREAGEIQIDSFLNRIDKKIEVDHHDMGFLVLRGGIQADWKQERAGGRHKGGGPVDYALPSGGGIYPGMGSHGCAGELPPDH